MIEVKNVVKKYGSHIAVDHLSFTAEPGRIYGLLGENGAGKSTTMNIMTGYIGATKGDVLINGHSILEEPNQAKRHIGYLPEIPPLYTDMTVNEYLTFSAKLKKIPIKEIPDNLERVKKITHIEDVEKRLIKNLSKGYRQRVGLAYAILGFPEIIILDEPTVGLDPKQIIEIRDVIRELAKEHTVILSSHILQEISAVCDYILIISHGKLVISDSIENLKEMMNTANILQIRIKGGFDAVKEYFDNLTGLDAVSYEQDKDFIKVEAEFDGNEEMTEEIFYGCAEHKLPIYEVSCFRKSFEELFLELTDDNKEVKK